MLAQSVNHVTLDTSPSPTKSDGDSAYAKQTERLLNGKGGGAGRRNSAVLERVVRRVWQSLSLATDKAERILNILESQSKTIHDRSSLVAIQLPLARDGHGCPKLNAQRLCKDAKPTERS